MKTRYLLASVISLWVVSVGAQPAVSELVYDGKIVDAIEFFKPHAGGNGRACATCHRPETISG
jgi:hypothetical protein